MQDIEIEEPVDEQRIFVVGPDPLATDLAVQMTRTLEAEGYVCTKPYRQLMGQYGVTAALAPGWEKTEYRVTPLQDVMLEKGMMQPIELPDPQANSETMLSFFREQQINVRYIDEHGVDSVPHGGE